jgi:Na+-translocating ferredoxin:NAD+ oxidoreductase RnfE subunit
MLESLGILISLIIINCMIGIHKSNSIIDDKIIEELKIIK